MMTRQEVARRLLKEVGEAEQDLGAFFHGNGIDEINDFHCTDEKYRKLTEQLGEAFDELIIYLLEVVNND